MSGLSDALRREFGERGFVRIPRAFSRDAADAMEQRLWKTIERRFGMRCDAPQTWMPTAISGLGRLRSDPVFEPIGSDVTRGALDALLGPGRWREPKHWGQLLVNFPDRAAAWTVPWRPWHTDYPFTAPPDRLFGLLLFSFVSDVAAGSGGTAIVAGSHRLVRRFVERQPREALTPMKRVRRRLLASEPWLRALSSPDDAGDRLERFADTAHEIDGIRVQVAQLSGEAGDVVVAHPWMLHCPAANCGRRPRMMCVARFARENPAQ